MDTQQIASRLKELCDNGDFETAQKELFANDAVSIEPYPTPMFETETRGLDAILEKLQKFEDMTEETHSLSVSEPVVAANSFALTMLMDITMKEKGRMNMKELCVYKVKDGKIVSEEFFV